jgi:tetrahydromethanopterin S-methyltransferase subunit F
MSYFSKRALRWAAPVALVGALGLAACGDNDDTEAVRVAAPSVAGLGSDQHLANKAEELARASAGAGSDQHLNNAAAELTAEQRAYQAASDRLTAQAEQYENAVEAGNRAAQMAQAESYVQQLQDRAVSSSGNRAAQMAQAESYVQQLQDRAESNSYEDEFVPGSRHMPMR